MTKNTGKIALNGLVSLVTGSASGLGYHIRQRLALKGAKILAVDINHKTDIEEDVKLKTSVSFITGDVSDRKFLDNMFAKYPKVDAVVNCAAAYRSYNYFTSYLVSKHALDVMKNNAINEYGIRGCIINIIGLQQRYNEKYFEEQDIYSKKIGETIDSLDDKVMTLAEQLTANRIRSNSIIVPANSDQQLFAQIIQNIIEDQYIAGQIINMEDEFRPHLGTFKELMADYHIPPDPKTIPDDVKEANIQLPKPAHNKRPTQTTGNRTPLLRLDNKK
ncbi:3-hydroxyacyl-CoA dehydrogenase type-2-like [Oppia nitens]|uniref:3-hydroxyacyl-CoA dehydrogenase type-2-like n=1 Tax=Oppia nitens TaxID=1686743 RepID=UPI0023DC5247|nr:3-hydroxyacyl-CoA dehydrogenase type-2-like [Oppia nitens]